MFRLFLFVFSIVPLSAEAANLLHMFGNDFVGAQTEYRITSGITASEVAGSKALEVVVQADGHNFTLDFAPPAGQDLRTGKYTSAERYPFNAAGKPGLSVSGDGRGCNEVQGSFYVKHLKLKGGAVRSFAADFIQFCDNGVEPLKGSIRLNSHVADSIFEVLPLNEGPYDLKHGILFKAKKRAGAEVRRRANAKVGDAKLEVSVSKTGVVSIKAKKRGFTTFSKEITGATRAFIISKGADAGVYVANVRELSKVTSADFAAKDFPLTPAGTITVDLLPY